MRGAIEDKRETSRGHAVITRGYSGLRVGLQEGCPDPLDTFTQAKNSIITA